MDSLQFYKSLYDRELNRRKDLDDAINLPITVLSIIAAANTYLLANFSFNYCEKLIIYVISLLLFVSFSISVFYLTRSYNNLFKGFAYTNFALSKEIRTFETVDIPNFNKQVSDNESISFENSLIEMLNQYTDDHIVFNDKRSSDLYKSKAFLIVSLLFTGILFLFYFIHKLSV